MQLDAMGNPTNIPNNDVTTADSSTVDNNDVYEDATETEFDEEQEFDESEDFQDQEDEDSDVAESDEESSTSVEDSDLVDQKIPYERFKEVNEKMNGYKQEAEQYKPFVEAMQSIGIDHSVSTEDLTHAVSIVKQFKTNPQQALESLIPVMQDLQAKAGLVLSPELQRAVEHGDLTEEYALKVSQADAASAITKNNHEQTVKQIEQEKERAEHNKQISSIQGVIGSFKESKAGNPDFKKIEPLLADKFNNSLNMLRQSNGRMPTPEEVQGALEKSYAEVEKTLQNFKPRKKASKVINNESSNNASGSNWRERVARGEI